MEHSSSAVNWQPRNLAKAPGEMARNSLSHLARGADAILFFQWRASRRGAEKFHSAMLPHAGANSRVFQEIVQLGADLQGLDAVRGSQVKAQAAILWDWESLWAQDLDWRPTVDLFPRQQVREYYERLWRDKVTVDFAHPTADLSAYQVVLAPASYLLTAEAVANLTATWRAAGTWWSARSPAWSTRTTRCTRAAGTARCETCCRSAWKRCCRCRPTARSR